MRPALSHNELEILDRQVATLSYQLSEIARSLESRLGETSELAKAARDAQREFAKFAQRVRRRVALADTTRPDSDSRTA
jgi:predicted  nucleic acid-binding Zn-ribbon protein